MSKRAEDYANRQYPKMWINKTHTSYEKVDMNEDCRRAAMIAYEQAEKDLALTWQDVAKIITIYEAAIDNGEIRRYNEAEWMKEYSQYILRKFNEIGKK